MNEVEVHMRWSTSTVCGSVEGERSGTGPPVTCTTCRLWLDDPAEFVRRFSS